MRKFSHQELQERQRPPFTKKPFCVVLNDVRSLYNVGSIFRTADGAGLEKIWLCGITGIPPSSKISKTALGAEKTVPWEYISSAKECIASLKEQGYEIVLLEQTPQSIPYNKYCPAGPVCLVLGNEVGGISESLLPSCSAVIEIPMSGLKISLNVTVAFGIAAYQIRSRMMEKSVIAGTSLQ